MPSIETHPVGSGLHFIQEDQSGAMGQKLADWLKQMRRASSPRRFFSGAD